MPLYIVRLDKGDGDSSIEDGDEAHIAHLVDQAQENDEWYYVIHGVLVKTNDETFERA